MNNSISQIKNTVESLKNTMQKKGPLNLEILLNSPVRKERMKTALKRVLTIPQHDKDCIWQPYSQHHTGWKKALEAFLLRSGARKGCPL